VAVHANRFGFWLCSSRSSQIACPMGATLWNVLRRIRRAVISAKNRTTWLIQLALIGGK
jgi:hypothetical protein